jgi:hypothetical protein
MSQFFEKETSMLKVQVLVSRRADFTVVDFRRYWKEKHGSLFSSQPEVK